MNETFFIYILQSKKDGSYYVGQTNNLTVRINQHNAGLSKYTSSKRPLDLVYYEIFETRSEAIKREIEIKKKKSRVYIENLILNFKNTFN
ncbi:MAG: GIY-YIG nuclease family protein [Chitinophagaceae bacterium]|nr:GIY-YIG nuclease family protein [Chitinophagaceae bacterium]